jgi:hypothetical protein
MLDYGEINSRGDSYNVPRLRQEVFSTKVLLIGTPVPGGLDGFCLSG